MRLLGGVNNRITEENREEKKGHEEEISKEEVKEVFKRIKKGKAGIDGIPGEAWKYGGTNTMEWTWIFYNRVWKGEGWPEEWKEG